MNTVSIQRTIPAPEETVRAAMEDVEPFMAAAGFDEVGVDGVTVRVANRVGPKTIELILELVDDPEAALTYVQRDGIFEEMETTYTTVPLEGTAEDASGTEVTATTEFALDVAVVGDFLDSTVIERQRKKELGAQFDWLEGAVTS